MDRTNLIYNGDFSLGTDSWISGTVSNNVLTITGNLIQNTQHYVPVSNDYKYRLTYDIKFNSKGTNPFYIALYPYDSNRTLIGIAEVYKPVSGCDTTLAAALNNGDTTVTLTDGSKWPTSRANQGIGICNLLAYGYKRCSYRQPFSSRNGNVITLKTAWSGGSWPVGTKVSNFEAGAGYFYPHYLPNASFPTDWTTYSVEFDGGDAIRYSCKYFRFTTLGYNHNYSIRNIRIECINNIQLDHTYKNEVDLTKQGVLTSTEFNDIGMPIRYIRDTIAGSTANTYNHWNEMQIFNYVGENIAWGKDVVINNTNYSNSVITDGIINSSYIPSGLAGTVTAQIDLGYIENIHKIKIWHYYPDGRTYYNNVTEVSVDGVNWHTVYSGQKPETAAGNEIILSANKTLFKKNGEVFANELIEL